MHLSYYLILLTVFGYGFATDLRIVGGRMADPGELPYQVSYRFHGRHKCGGSLYSYRHIITAAHCVMDKNNEVVNASYVTIAAGGVNLNDGTMQIRQAIHIVAHERYKPEYLLNDIAIVKVSPEFYESYVLKVVPIIRMNTGVSLLCVMSGWGSIYEGGPFSNVLLKINVETYSIMKCKKALSGVSSFTGGMICTANPDGEQDSCMGDFGGPLVCRGKLTGILSWGYGCGRSGYPKVYTDVYRNNGWIDRHGGGHCIQNSIVLIVLSLAFSINIDN